MHLALSYDRRLTDGSGAVIMPSIKDAVEDIMRLLIDL